jgi:hypothetical protein
MRQLRRSIRFILHPFRPCAIDRKQNLAHQSNNPLLWAGAAGAAGAAGVATAAEAQKQPTRLPLLWLPLLLNRDL